MSQRANEPTKENGTDRGRRGFVAQVAASVAAAFLVRLSGLRGKGGQKPQSVETAGRLDAMRLPSPKGSVKRRG